MIAMIRFFLALLLDAFFGEEETFEYKSTKPNYVSDSE